jgi:sulfoxide reductase catalytic subunit YedY
MQGVNKGLNGMKIGIFINTLNLHLMANFIIPRSWQRIRERITDESIYQNRREILKKLGLAGGGLLMSPFLFPSCTSSNGSASESVSQADNNFSFPGMMDLYPPKKNETFPLDRPITDEYLATHQNNFYEFIHPKDPNIYNAYKYTQDFDTRDWSFEVSGLAGNTGKFALEEMIKKFGLEERTYRFRCVEAWSMAVPWTGFSFASLVKFLKPESSARYIRFLSAADENQMPGVKNQPWYSWPYFEGLRMDEAMNELAFMATGIYGKPLPKQNGAPMRLLVPWKYGYKNAKSIVKIEFIRDEPETFWHKVAPSEYGFYSNVNPGVPHPRWSQAQEQMLGEDTKRPTLLYNGYGEWVAQMYS